MVHHGGCRLFVVILFACFVCVPGSIVRGFHEKIIKQLLKNQLFCDPDPDICRNVTELITSKGYPVEEYTVQTRDGFLLGVQRIPASRFSVRSSPRPVVFLQHGLLSAATCWVSDAANESLGFELADAGYDVWLGNVRGNTYSRRHTTLRPDQKEFWEWSWDEMAAYDLPAMLTFVLKKTGQKQLYYIGHSQGTLIAMTRFSQDQNLASKVKLFIGLGPVATVGSIKTPLRVLAHFKDEIKDLFDRLGQYDFLPNSDILKMLGSTVCRDHIAREICENILFLFAGSDAKNFNVSRLPVYVAHSPAGTSVQNMVHFGQMVLSGICQMYDYGSKTLNKIHYHQPVPPVYDLRTMRVPSYLFSAEYDDLSDPDDVRMLLSTLPNVRQHVQIPDWNHLDFIWGLDATSVLYNRLIAILRANPIN